MKKTIFILSAVFLIGLTASCAGGNEPDNVKYTWAFGITKVITTEPLMEGYPITTDTTVVQDNLTEEEAEIIRQTMGSTTTETEDGYKKITTITVTKAIQE